MYVGCRFWREAAKVLAPLCSAQDRSILFSVDWPNRGGMYFMFQRTLVIGQSVDQTLPDDTWRKNTQAYRARCFARGSRTYLKNLGSSLHVAWFL